MSKLFVYLMILGLIALALILVNMQFQGSVLQPVSDATGYVFPGQIHPPASKSEPPAKPLPKP